MGTGKTPTAIEVMHRLSDAQRKTNFKGLIVCPALVRQNWERELGVWWPNHPEIGRISFGGARKQLSKAQRAQHEEALLSNIQIVSYNLLHEVETLWDMIIFDEAHRLRSASTTWSKKARELVEQNPSAAVLALTATVMPDKPQDAHNLLDTLWGGRFGTRHKFQDRYQLFEPNDYAISGKTFHGVNPLYAQELRTRIAAVSSRTTKGEIAHLLPPYDVQALRVPGKKWTLKDWSDNAVENALQAAAVEKIPHVLEWAADALASCTHVTVMVHHKELARQVGRMLQEKTGVPVYLATGDVTADKRNEVLDNARTAPTAVVVATMDAVGIGIDMTFTPQCLFAELSYRPDIMLQALGRFSRLSGTVPSTCRLLVIEGTPDEIIAAKLETKVKAINQAIKSGAAETALQNTLSVDTGNWKNELRAAVEAQDESGGYLDE